MEWVPAARLEVEKVAVPPLRVPVPSVAVPSRKVTVPVGVPAPGVFTLTVAVNVTLWPKAEGLVSEDNARGCGVRVDGLAEGARSHWRHRWCRRRSWR